MNSTQQSTLYADYALFLDRLDAFKQKTLSDIAIFAAREDKDVDEIRRNIAEWHCKYLFDASGRLEGSDPSSSQGGSTSRSIRQTIRTDLESISSHLDSLSRAVGLHSFVLVIDPDDDSDDGFLGGTVLGREYWREMRNGGTVGARNFRKFCRSAVEKERSNSREQSRNTDQTRQQQPETTATGTKRTPAIALKNKLYEEMRNALRSACGIRNAEMKWSKPEKLSTAYGVTMAGWPQDIPFKNPSHMAVGEMSRLLALISNKTIHFVRVSKDNIQHGNSQVNNASSSEITTNVPQDDGSDIDISWACNEDALNEDVLNVTPSLYLPSRGAPPGAADTTCTHNQARTTNDTKTSGKTRHSTALQPMDARPYAPLHHPSTSHDAINLCGDPRSHEDTQHNKRRRLLG